MTRVKLRSLLEEYGPVAIGTYFAIFVLTFAGFALAISFGLSVESTQGGLGLVGAAYVATKLSQPLRIAGALALTPFVAAGLKKLRGARGGAEAATVPATPSGDDGAA